MKLSLFLKLTVINGLLLLFSVFQLYAQKETEKIKTHLQANAAKYHLSANDLKEMSISSAYLSPTTGWYHAYYKQVYQSIEVYNGLLNVTFTNNEVAHVANKFIENLPSKITNDNFFAHLLPANAIDKLARHLKLAYTSGATKEENTIKLASGQISYATFSNADLSKEIIPVKLYWYPYHSDTTGTEAIAVKLVWNIQLKTKDTQNYWNAQIDVESGEILSLTDLLINCNFDTPAHLETPHLHKHATIVDNPKPDFQFFTPFAANSYNVFDIPTESPNHGTRSIVTNPYDRFVPMGTFYGSTNGWHDTDLYPYYQYRQTKGNNVEALADIDGPNGNMKESTISSTLDFNYPFTHGLNTASSNRHAATTNLFYWGNLLHDILWKYGFDEPSGNYQYLNMGRGGREGDYIYLFAQEGSARNNARFWPSPDGLFGILEMFLWDDTGTPAYQPDSDFDNGIICHEYGHGWSTRLTGGPATSTCLYNAEQGGEGWSDYLGVMLTTNWAALTPTAGSANIARGVGTYVMGQASTGKGIRQYPYSYDMANVNAAVTYDKVANYSIPHGIGSIWATILWDMTWEIILQDNQIVNNIYNTSLMVGNVAALKLVNEGLRIQPCSPSFVDSRNAILKADSLLFNGRYNCAIWKAFARRGVGHNASTGASSNDRTVYPDFTPIYSKEWVLTSPLTVTTCSQNVFNYTATSDSTTAFRWFRAALPGISNPSASGNSATINETLINTTDTTLVVTYLFSVMPGSCQPPLEVKVTVYPSPKLNVANYAICQNGTIPAGEGLVALPLPHTNTAQNTFVAGEATYWRSEGATATYNPAPQNLASAVYYQAHTFIPGTSESVTLKALTDTVANNSTSRVYLALYLNSFNPASPATNFLYGDSSKISYNLIAGANYVLVVSPYTNETTGTCQIEATSNIFEANYWYAGSTGGVPLAMGNVFNPIEVAGSGISNTGAPLIKTFYLANNSFNLCRSAATFRVDTASVGGNITGSSNICTDINQGILTLHGSTGTIVGWESSVDNFASITQLPDTARSITYKNLTQTTQYRAVVKNASCSALTSTVATITKLTITLPTVTDFAICQYGTIQEGKGLTISIPAQSNVANSTFSTSSPTYWRGRGNNTSTYLAAQQELASAVYYQTHTFTPSVSGLISIETVVGALSGAYPQDTYLALYAGSFNPAMPATNFLKGDDNSGVLPYTSKITYNFTAGTTYILVVSPSANNITGSCRVQATASIFGNTATWYANSYGGSPLATGTVFNPAEVAGTGINGTSNLLKKTFFVETTSFSACRVPAEFSVNTLAVGGVLKGSASFCSEAATGTISLQGNVNNVLRWEASMSNLLYFAPINNTSNTLTYNNLPETTIYRAVINNWGCAEAYSSMCTITKVVGLPSVADYSVCQDNAISSGQGLVAGNPSYTNYASGTLTSDSPVYWRSDINSQSSYRAAPIGADKVYYKTYTFTATNTDIILADLIAGTLSEGYGQAFLALYHTSFDPNNPAANYLTGSDKGSYIIYSSRIGHVITAGETYILVVSGYRNDQTGTYQIKTQGHLYANQNIFYNPNTWYATLSGGDALATGNVFDPTRVIGSGVPNTSVPVVKTFYVGSAGFGNCRVPATFTINPFSVGGSISGDTLACTSNHSGTLTLGGHTGKVTHWESSTDMFASINPIENTSSTLTYTNINQPTHYRAVVKNGACNVARSPTVTVTRTINSPIPTSISRCGPGVVTLTATGCTTGIPNWYLELNGGSPIATGATYTTTSLLTNTTYYVGCISDYCTSDRVPAAANINISANYNNQQMNQLPADYRFSETITSSIKIPTGINYFAGKSVLLSPGFQAGGNSLFTAQIEPCP